MHEDPLRIRMPFECHSLRVLETGKRRRRRRKKKQMVLITWRWVILPSQDVLLKLPQMTCHENLIFIMTLFDLARFIWQYFRMRCREQLVLKTWGTQGSVFFAFLCWLLGCLKSGIHTPNFTFDLQWWIARAITECAPTCLFLKCESVRNGQDFYNSD